MKNNSHDKQMADVYGHIYGAFYDFKQDAMTHASTIISSNLNELGVAAGSLHKLSVLNVGTGREALVFHQLGAGKVFHFDVSSRSVQNLQELSKKDDFKIFTQLR